MAFRMDVNIPHFCGNDTIVLLVMHEFTSPYLPLDRSMHLVHSIFLMFQ